MKETTPATMPPCFEKWCQKLELAFKTKAQKKELRHYSSLSEGFMSLLVDNWKNCGD